MSMPRSHTSVQLQALRGRHLQGVASKQTTIKGSQAATMQTLGGVYACGQVDDGLLL